MKILITGGCGFVGHHFVEYFLKKTNWEICILDKLTYASHRLDRLRDIDAYDDKRVQVFTADISKPISVGIREELARDSGVQYILHLGAETHVDNSIIDPELFVMSNVVGTFHILNFARTVLNLKALIFFSTDEVFGPAPVGIAYREWDRYNCTNPYSATKAGAEELTLAFMNTYGIPGFITHCMNIFGERQHAEKFIPMCIRKIQKGEILTIHSDKTKKISGTRFYIHARNVASAIHYLFTYFHQREKYNIVGEQEISNLDLAMAISKIMGKSLNYQMVDFHSSRPGHDLRYALDGERMSNLGWDTPVTFMESLEKTVKWALLNPKWHSKTD